jgi:single-strand DNA-binding protein
MSRSLNKVMLIGNVGNDPELKTTPGGIPISFFRIATTETFKNRDSNDREHTEWHTVIAWRGLAEVIHKIVRRGSRVYVEGKLQTRSFLNNKGIQCRVSEIVAENLLLLDHKRYEDEPSINLENDLIDISDDTFHDLEPLIFNKEHSKDSNRENGILY